MTNMLGKVKWLNVVLFFSLAMNFFVAGYLASDSKIVKRFSHEGPRHKRPEIMLLDYFPKEQRRHIKELMGQHKEELRQRKKDIFLNQREILNLIGAKMIDESALRGAFNKHQKAHNEFQSSLNDLLIKGILEMDYETRQEIVKRGEKAHERRNHH